MSAPAVNGAVVNAMTVDVEDYFHVSALSESIDRGDWDKMEYRADKSTERLLELFETKRVEPSHIVVCTPPECRLRDAIIVGVEAVATMHGGLR